MLDEEAFDEFLAEDPDAALGLLASMTTATDERLRDLARRLAGRVLVDVARRGVAERRGIGRLRRHRGAADGEVDLDASLDAIVAARAAGRPVSLADLSVAAWQRPDTAVCLVVDRSGSMAGERLSTAAVAAAAVLYRHPSDCSVLAFSDDAIVLSSQGATTAADEVVADLLRLRGHGTTDVAMALRAARNQLDRSRAARKVVLLLSDCRVTSGAAAEAEAAALEELAILCPAEDRADADALAAAVGAVCIGVHGPSEVPSALSAAFG